MTNTEVMLELQRVIGLVGNGYMTVAECAEYLRCTSDHIYDLVASRDIPHVREGRRILFIRRDIDRWMERRRVKTNDEIASIADTMIETRKLTHKR